MGYFTYKSQIILLLSVYLLRVFAITTRLEQELSTSRKHRHNLGTLPIPEWELGLREAIYQALLNENKLQVKNLHEFIHAAPLLRRQNSATPFGDIVIMGRGQLYSAPGGFQLLQDYYTNDCDGCHNPPPRCERSQCENWKPLDHERLLALWTAKRIRHRDTEYGYRYEFEYKISPMSMVANERFVTRNGNFDYSVSGYTFVVRVDPQQTSHRFYRQPNQAYDFFDTFNSPTWTPSSSSNYENNFYLPPPIPTINEYNDPDPRKEGLPNSLYNAPDYPNIKNKITTTTTTTTTERHINDKEFENELFQVTTSTLATKIPTGPITTTNAASSSSKTFPTTVGTTVVPMKITQPVRTSSPPFLPTINSHYTSTTHGNVYTTITPSTAEYVTQSTPNVEVSTRTTRGTKNTKPYPIYSSTGNTSPVTSMSFKPSPTKTTNKFKLTTSRFKTTKNTDDFDLFGENSNSMNLGTTSGYSPITIVTSPTPSLQNNKGKKPNTSAEGTLQSELFDNFEPKLPTTKSRDENVPTIITSTESEATTTTTTSTTRMTTRMTSKSTRAPIKSTTKRKQSTSRFTSNDKVTKPTFYTTKSRTFSPFKTMVFSVPLTTPPTLTLYTTKISTEPINIFDMFLTTSASTKTTSNQNTIGTSPIATSQSDVTSTIISNNTILTSTDIIYTTPQKLFPTTQETSTLEIGGNLITTYITSTSSKMLDITTPDSTSENILTSNVPNITEDSNTTPIPTITTKLTSSIFTVPARKTTKLSIVTKIPMAPLTEITKTIVSSAPTTPTYDFLTTTPAPIPTTQQIRPMATTIASTYSTATTKLNPLETFTTKRSNMRTSVGTSDNFLFDKNINELPKVTQGIVTKNNNFYFDIFGETFTTKSTTTTSKIPFKTKEIDDIFGKEPEDNKHKNMKMQSISKPKNEPEIIYADFYSPSTANYNKDEKYDETTKLPNNNLYQKNESRPTEFEHLTSQSYITSVSYKVNKKNQITTETYDNIGTKFQEVSSHLNDNDTDITTKTNLSPTVLIKCNETHPQTNNTSLDALALTVLNNAKSITYLNSNIEQTTPISTKYKRRNGYKLRKFKRIT